MSTRPRASRTETSCGGRARDGCYVHPRHRESLRRARAVAATSCCGANRSVGRPPAAGARPPHRRRAGRRSQGPNAGGATAAAAQSPGEPPHLQVRGQPGRGHERVVLRSSCGAGRGVPRTLRGRRGARAAAPGRVLGVRRPPASPPDPGRPGRTTEKSFCHPKSRSRALRGVIQAHSGRKGIYDTRICVWGSLPPPLLPAPRDRAMELLTAGDACAEGGWTPPPSVALRGALGGWLHNRLVGLEGGAKGAAELSPRGGFSLLCRVRILGRSGANPTLALSSCLYSLVPHRPE